MRLWGAREVAAGSSGGWVQAWGGHRARVQATVEREWWECYGAVMPSAMVLRGGSIAATSACRSLCGLLTGSRPLLLWLLTLLRR